MSGTDDPTHVYWDLENRKGLWAKGEAMTDELPQIKARLEEYACGWDGDDYKLVTDVRAALQRMEGLEERLRQICCGCGESALTHRIDYGQPSVVRQESDDGACGLDQCGEWLWVGADKELVALRQRVEEAEHKEYLQFERAERLHQRVDDLEAGENECCDCYDAARDAASSAPSR